MRYIIYGAGAIGGVIGGRLHAAGHHVVLIARGDNLEALQANGLRLRSRDHDRVYPITAVSRPAEAEIQADDVVLLGMKTQDTAAALEELSACAPSTTPIFCAQNGVENERLASRLFAEVNAMYVFIFAASLVPGRVQCYTEPSGGVCDIGTFPRGLSPVAATVAEHFVGAGFDTRADDNIMRWKYGKLLGNLANALQALVDDLTGLGDVYEGLRAEAETCYDAAGIDYVPWADQEARFGAVMPLALIDGKPFPGGSSWQSLTRGSPRLETDYLNGEITLLGKLTGVPTPLNALMQRLMRSHVSVGGRAGGIAAEQLRALTETATVGLR